MDESRANKKAAAAARTRDLLERVARELFETRGFAAVSAEEIVAQAGVTRGALYHHYGGKEGLFEQVAEAAMGRLHESMVKSARAATDVIGALKLGGGRFLELAAGPRAQQVLFIDAPAVLGWQRWRQMDERHGFGLLKQAITQGMQAGQLREQSPDLVAHIVLGAMVEAAMVIARSDHKTTVRDEAQAVLNKLIDGLA